MKEVKGITLDEVGVMPPIQAKFLQAIISNSNVKLWDRTSGYATSQIIAAAQQALIRHEHIMLTLWLEEYREAELERTEM